MVGYSANFVASVIATFVPIYAGLFLPAAIEEKSDRRLRILMAVCSGIVFWFFLDVMDNAVLLDLYKGFAGGLEHFLLATLFAFGLLLLFCFELVFAKSSVREARRSMTGISYSIVLLVALGIGFRGLGGGIEIGSLIPTASTMIDAFGGLAPSVAYVLHKSLEGFVIGVFAIFARTKPTRVLILGVVSGIPTVIGFVLAALMPINSAFFFALAGAAAVYVEYKLIPNFAGRVGAPIYVIALLIGFYSMYVTRLFQ